VANALGLVFIGGNDLSTISQVDSEGTLITIELDYGFLLTCTLLKILVGAMIYYQGKWIRAIFKPLLKEYVDAERGHTNGVAMVKRHSKEMQKLRCKIKKNTCGCILIMFVALYSAYGMSV